MCVRGYECVCGCLCVHVCMYMHVMCVCACPCMYVCCVCTRQGHVEEMCQYCVHEVYIHVCLLSRNKTVLFLLLNHTYTHMGMAVCYDNSHASRVDPY